ncbi:MAG: redoxin domain-containing protein [Paludibacteraceae bacterium]|nr:redoxin domain-containing protein [Paludibacteraceae bacterium]
MKAKKIIFEICRILTGLVFIFSGTVKAIDPLGTEYKITDYLMAMNLESLSFLATVGAFALFGLEFVAGVCLVTRMNFKIGLWLSSLFMVVMTPLTVWIALTDPVSDCGCFGDALVLTNWHTLYKNIVLDILIIIMWLFKSVSRSWKTTILSWIISFVALCVVVGFGIATLFSIPVMDFRPYYVGSDIREQMLQPIGTHPDKYETTFIYSKNGVEKEFALMDVPVGDSTWVFVDQKTTLVEKGVLPPIHDFIIETMDGEDITDEILDDNGKTYMVVMWDLNKTDTTKEIMDGIARLYNKARKEGARFIGLTASDDITLTRFVEENNIGYEICFMDPIQLKTMVRANPGIFVVEKGKVVEKYNARKLMQKTK